MKQTKLFNNSKLYITILLIATGIFFYLRSENRELIYVDEIIYGYNLNASEYYEYWSSPSTSLNEKVETLSDIIKSQYNHYFYGNGRSIIHAVQQLFTGIFGVSTFYIINTFVFLIVICVSVKLLKMSDIYIGLSRH